MTSTLTDLFVSRVSALQPERLDVADDSSKHAGHAGNNGGGHLSAKIVASAFVGKSTVQRHRAVYALVDDLMPHTLHALALSTLTPDEAAASKSA
ncbi:MAG: BolA family protein [Casimicrobium sp.]